MLFRHPGDWTVIESDGKICRRASLWTTFVDANLGAEEYLGVSDIGPPTKEMGVARDST